MAVPAGPPPGFVDFSRSIIPRLAEGAAITLEVTAGAFALGVVLATFAALMRISRSGILRGIAGVYVTVIRGTPALVQIYFVYNVLPQIARAFEKESPWAKDLLTLGPLATGILALGINAGAYIAEIIRAGIQSIDKGQMEAARSVGMSYSQAMRRIIIPQTYRRLLPPMLNELVALTKDSSLVGVVGLAELFRAGREMASRTFRFTETYLWISVFYLAMTMVLSVIANRLEKKLEARE